MAGVLELPGTQVVLPWGSLFGPPVSAPPPSIKEGVNSIPTHSIDFTSPSSTALIVGSFMITPLSALRCRRIIDLPKQPQSNLEGRNLGHGRTQTQLQPASRNTQYQLKLDVQSYNLLKTGVGGEEIPTPL